MFLTVWSQLRFEFHIIERQFKSSAFPFAIHSNKCILVVWSFRAEFITFGWRLYSKNWRNCQLTAKWIWDFLDSFRWSSLPEGRLGHTSPTTSSFKPWHCVIHPPATRLATDITTHDPLLLLEGECQGSYPRCHTVHSSRADVQPRQQYGMVVPLAVFTYQAWLPLAEAVEWLVCVVVDRQTQLTPVKPREMKCSEGWWEREDRVLNDQASFKYEKKKSGKLWNQIWHSIYLNENKLAVQPVLHALYSAKAN